MKLTIRRLGDPSAPTVVLLHGIPAPAQHLMPLAQALARSSNVLVPELPGYDASPRITPYTFEAVRRALEDGLVDVGVQRAAVVGYSAGSYRALELALSARVQVSALALLAPIPGLDDATRVAYRDLEAPIRAGAVDLGEFMVQRTLPPGFAQAQPEAAAEVRGWHRHTTAEVVADEAVAFAEAKSLLPELARIRVPVVARVGELDVAAPVAYSTEIVSRLPGAKLQVVPGVGHGLLLEDCPGTLRSIEELLARAA